MPYNVIVQRERESSKNKPLHKGCLCIWRDNRMHSFPKHSLCEGFIFGGDMERDFKGVWIPKEIWLDDRLTALEKVILAEIDSLDTDEYGGCIAGNDYLAEFCKCSANKVALAVSKLKEMGYIELVSFDGRTRKLKSRLKENQRQTLKKSKADIEKEKAINIEDNIKDKKDNNRFIPPTVDEIIQFCKERNNGVDAQRVFDYYSSANWKDGRGNPVKNWKQKIIAVWEKDMGNKSSVGKVAHESSVYDKDFDENGNFIW